MHIKLQVAAYTTDGHSLNNIIAELVKEQRWRVRSQVPSNQVDFLRGLYTFDDFLGCPGAILMNANHRQVRTDTFKHGHTGREGTLFEKLLDDLRPVNGRDREEKMRNRLTVLPSQSEARSTISPSRKSAATCSISSSKIVFESILFRNSRNLDASQRLLCGRSETNGMVV